MRLGAQQCERDVGGSGTPANAVRVRARVRGASDSGTPANVTDANVVIHPLYTRCTSPEYKGGYMSLLEVWCPTLVHVARGDHP